MYFIFRNIKTDLKGVYILRDESQAQLRNYTLYIGEPDKQL